MVTKEVVSPWSQIRSGQTAFVILDNLSVNNGHGKLALTLDDYRKFAMMAFSPVMDVSAKPPGIEVDALLADIILGKRFFDQTVEANLNLAGITARWFIKRWPNTPLDLDDCYDVAAEGLMRAVARFDPGRGILFRTYSLPIIRGRIIDEMRGLMPMARSMKKRRDIIEDQRWIFYRDHGVMPNQHELAGLTNLSCEQLRRAKAVCGYDPLSLEVMTSGTEPDGIMGDRFLIDDSQNVEEMVGLKDGVKRVHLAMGQLPDKERIVLELIFQGLTYREIASILGVSESYVSILNKQAIARMRMMFTRDNYLDD